MAGEADLLDRVSQRRKEYGSLVANGLQLQKELEAFYLRQEAHIRQRVALIDEIQSCLKEERRCLERQHQECRQQISASRRKAAALGAEGSELAKSLHTVAAVLLQEERALDEKNAELLSAIADEDRELSTLLDRRAQLQREAKELTVRESRQQEEESNLDKALREIEGLADEIGQRKNSLLRRNESIAEWNRSLESRERDLASCQDRLRGDLRQLESDECRHGLGPACGSATIIPVISQRELMDNHDMSIERENHREEIDLEEED